MAGFDEHLAPILGVNNDAMTDESDLDDSCIEITSVVDENESELIEWTTYLQLNSSSDDDSGERWTSTQSASLVQYSPSEDSSDNECASHTTHSSSKVTLASPSTIVKKRKRQHWTVSDKLRAIDYFETTNNKDQTAKYMECATKQVWMWVNNKKDLLDMSSRKKGNKRKRLDGGGKKLTYVELDVKLLQWYRTKRTAPETTANVADIRKEKVTFRRLERCGRQISADLNHPCPSSKWFGRFLVRHQLSLQRPKRQQKIPLDEVHQKTTSFYSFLRQASRCAPKRGAMGAFTSHDIFNMDESPLSLFGDQTKRSINDINTCNEVEGCLSNKRFCTIILTVSGEDQRVGPVLLFKGMGRVSPNEEKQYAQGVKIYFTPKSVNNKQTMDKYNQWFISQVQDGNPKLLIVDSVKMHLNPESIRLLRQKSVVIAVIPTGCTMYLQVLDTSIFSVFKKHYNDAAEEYLDLHAPRSKIKLTASQSRILCTRLTITAWRRTISKVDFKEEFQRIGYIWEDDSPLSPRTLPGYTFDPKTVDYSSTHPNTNDDEQRRIVTQAHLADDKLKMTASRSNRQTTIDHFWKT